jgi:hypothetical protein
MIQQLNITSYVLKKKPSNQTKHLFVPSQTLLLWNPLFSLRILNDLSMKEGSLFSFVLFSSYEIHQTGVLQMVFLVSFGKLSTRRGASWALVPWYLDLQCKSS